MRLGVYRNDNKELTPVRYSATAINGRHASVPPNTPCFRLHWHDRLEFIRIREGNLQIVYGANTHTLYEGDLFVLLPQVPHRAYTTDCAAEYDVLMFDIRSFYNDSPLCKLFLPAVYDGRALLNIHLTHPDLKACFDDLHANWTENSLSITAKVYWFLYLLLEHNLIELRESTKKDEQITTVINYIESHYNEEISISQLCELVQYSTTHLTRKFKKEVGLAPISYLRIYRLEKAYSLLKDGKKNISEIARQCGFTDANYFTRCFKAHFGYAPTRLEL